MERVDGSGRPPLAPGTPGSPGTSATTWRRAEEVARASYGRLLAILAAGSGDIELAEDCLADAFLQALRRWPESGAPDNPEAWLLAVARNRRRDLFRSAAHRTRVVLDDDEATSPIAAAGLATNLDVDLDPDAVPDRRLALMFVCAHPAVDPGVRAPLMLQTVLGLDARQIAGAFLVRPSTMAQRLVRAKRRIRDARLPFVVPGRDEMASRLGAVLEAIYATYAVDWPLVSGTTLRESLAGEAHYLAVTVAELLGDEPEAFGLAALIALSLARTDARGRPEGFVPLDEQDTSRWDRDLIARGESHLRRAHALGRIGRFQVEAAIQSVHCDRAVTGVTDWAALRTLYAALLDIAPTLGARVAHAATIGQIDGPDAGLAALDAVQAHPVDGRAPAIERFQPAWATRAHLLAEAGRITQAREAFTRAISLTTDPSARVYLERRRAELV